MEFVIVGGLAIIVMCILFPNALGYSSFLPEKEKEEDEWKS
jgi:hypothetical protein